MGLIIAIVCISAGVLLLVPLLVQLLKSDDDKTGVDLRDKAEAPAISAAG